MRALVFGGTGMLGLAVAREWRRRGDAVLALSRSQADVTSREAVLAWARDFRPQAIVNCAAFTAVDDCETQEERATEVNGDAVGHLAAAADDVDAVLLHVSTDYVFDGESERPYREDDSVAPRSAYGRSKLLGETRALEARRAIVVRTSWLFGPGGDNFVTTMRGHLLAGKELRVVDDQTGGPTYTPYLARALYDLAGRGDSAHGILHYQNRDPVTWFGFAEAIARIVAPDASVSPCTTADFPRPAPRPTYSVLATGRFERLVERPVESWSCGLYSYLVGDRSK